MKYKFRVGDYVEDVTGRIGYISSFCKCKFCKERGFYEPHVVYNNGDFDYITVYEYKKGFPSYKRIGQYDFTKKAEDKNENKIEPLVKSRLLETVDGEDKCYFDSREVIGKINELVEAVNRLEEKVIGMAQS